ncbi:DNA double-strand break repair Rad50 ATPase [Quillaja saponaria]|uniref:DNA double-strand break repair Rad50 ATPase n=1 Tax=Quillaja saponaria TaxID=32244 RepID=A0AAD7PTQ5_QUISA|nr:DNA double-strand break repair Rad50 ATPase [Quillaja saponaria]
MARKSSRHKEAALTAAVEALQESSAAERILKCLSTYSELLSAKGDNQQLSVDKFLGLQDNLNHTSLIVQQKNATSWIKEALASDLNPYFSPSSIISVQAGEITKKSNTNSGNKPKGMYFVRMQKNNAEMQIGLATDCSTADWIKGSTIGAAADLTSTLQDECRKWFLAHIENYLDEVKSKTISKSDHELAEMMRQMKRVNDRLDFMDGRNDGSALENSELEAYGRVRNKIYGVLLMNVERTCMALESINATAKS